MATWRLYQKPDEWHGGCVGKYVQNNNRSLFLSTLPTVFESKWKEPRKLSGYRQKFGAGTFQIRVRNFTAFKLISVTVQDIFFSEVVLWSNDYKHKDYFNLLRAMNEKSRCTSTHSAYCLLFGCASDNVAFFPYWHFESLGVARERGRLSPGQS